MKHRKAALTILAALCSSLALADDFKTGQTQNNFEWQDGSGNTHNLTELRAILRKVVGANLSGAHLYGALPSNANLIDATLIDVDLTDANLTGAWLYGANLSGANLRGTKLSDAGLSGARLGRALFEPKSLPELRGIAAAENLELLTYDANSDPLFQLRKQFEDGGFREQERRITYALKQREAELVCATCTSSKLPFRHPTRFQKKTLSLGGGDAGRAIIWSSDSILASCGSCVLNKAFFDGTCQYGMSPGRPLILGLLLWLLCSVLYFGFTHTSGESGLYRVYGQSSATLAPENRINQTKHAHCLSVICSAWTTFSCSARAAVKADRAFSF
jgi:uncharacterized protein YjbI with pentapeptide repeats